MDTGSATGTIDSLFQFVISLINDYAVPLIFALAFAFFIFGAFQFFIMGRGNEEKLQQGKTFMISSVIGFVVMFSIWGIVNLVMGTLPLENSQPAIPTLDTSNTTGGQDGSPFDEGGDGSGGESSGDPGSGDPGSAGSASGGSDSGTTGSGSNYFTE